MPDDPGADAGSLARDAMINRTLDRLRSLPGVQAAALMNVLPLSGDTSVDGLVRPDHPVPRAIEPMANRRFISPGYLEMMGIPGLIAGRDFDQRERENPRTVILSEKAAQAAFSNENPLGRKLLHWGRIYTVVGIAADARIVIDLKRNLRLHESSRGFSAHVPVACAGAQRDVRLISRQSGASIRR